jgi:rhomboid protease GluP
MEVLSTRDSWWMTQVEAALASEGIEARWIEPWQAGARGAMVLDVPTSEVERTSDILADQLAWELRKRKEARAAQRWVPLFLQPAFAAALCLALLFILFYGVTGGSDEASDWFRRGTFATYRFVNGEWWRIVTAATLHGDAAHVVGNAGFLLVLGWAANERFGSGVTLTLWLLTAVGGFVASLLFGDATFTVGASGGLFGLLGAAGSHGVKSIHKVEFPRRERLRVFGSAVALLAFTAFSPEANIAAHVGGFVTGALLGLGLPVGRHWRASTQLALAAASLLLIALAWSAS